MTAVFSCAVSKRATGQSCWPHKDQRIGKRGQPFAGIPDGRAQRQFLSLGERMLQQGDQREQAQHQRGGTCNSWGACSRSARVLDGTADYRPVSRERLLIEDC